jgi:hypothetical protein
MAFLSLSVFFKTCWEGNSGRKSSISDLGAVFIPQPKLKTEKEATNTAISPLSMLEKEALSVLEVSTIVVFSKEWVEAKE